MRPIGGLIALSLAAASVAFPVAAQPLATLTAHDLALYATAFDAAERGDAAGAEQALGQVADPCLAGRVRYFELTRAKARTASFDELSAWLKANGDVPGAGQVYEMALKKKPIDADLPPSAVLLDDDSPVVRTTPSPQNHAARDAYFSGDVRTALDLARRSGDAWIAGLAAYRLGDYRDAMVSFETIAANPSEAPATRAAGGFWGARAAEEAGFTDRATDLLKIAAGAPDTFYGMIAARKLQLSDDPLGRLIDASTVAASASQRAAAQGQSEFERLIGADPRARRAVALAQLGRAADAGAEMRAGYDQAPDDATKALWMGLMFELGPKDQASGAATGEIVLHAEAPMAQSSAVYPTPKLDPAGGFTVDKALVYAVVWQESRFNSLAVSPVGAVGLMQMMPATGASMTGDANLQSNPISLFDTGKNLALGQTYLNWLEANAAGYDILRTVAAYNGGPATVTRTEAMVGPDADSLMIIESVPFAETRAYVQKVMAAYWTYRRQFGGATRTLDAAAEGAAVIDARLDAGSAPAQGVQTEDAEAPAPAGSDSSLEIVLHRNG